VSTQGYEDELRSERDYVAGLYTRLDAERARVKQKHTAALRGNGGTPLERDDEVRALTREIRRLNIADNGLCFGRLDAVTGERLYIGRIGLFDEEHDYEPLLLDWRAPASSAFYTATGATPKNMRRRRQFHTRGRQVLEDYFWRRGGRPSGVLFANSYRAFGPLTLCLNPKASCLLSEPEAAFVRAVLART